VKLENKRSELVLKLNIIGSVNLFVSPIALVFYLGFEWLLWRNVKEGDLS